MWEIGQQAAQHSCLREKGDKQQSPGRAPRHSPSSCAVGRRIPQESGGLPELPRPRQAEMGCRERAGEEGLHRERAPENGRGSPRAAQCVVEGLWSELAGAGHTNLGAVHVLTDQRQRREMCSVRTGREARSALEKSRFWTHR